MRAKGHQPVQGLGPGLQSLNSPRKGEGEAQGKWPWRGRLVPARHLFPCHPGSFVIVRADEIVFNIKGACHPPWAGTCATPVQSGGGRWGSGEGMSRDRG